VEYLAAHIAADMDFDIAADIAVAAVAVE